MEEISEKKLSGGTAVIVWWHLMIQVHQFAQLTHFQTPRHLKLGICTHVQYCLESQPA